MTKSEIRNVIELFISWNGEKDPIDTANLDAAVEYISSCVDAADDPKPKRQKYIVTLASEDHCDVPMWLTDEEASVIKLLANGIELRGQNSYVGSLYINKA